VGLTGGIGAGKSTVSSTLSELGALVVDADRIAREVVQPGTPGLAAVVEAFGEGVLSPDGTLDRPALGSRVFGDDEARRVLNGVLHPLIGARTAELVAAAPADAVLLHDVPLLVENRMGAVFHLVVVVHTPEDERVDRLVSQRGMTEADARARIAAQASDDDRRAAADVWLDNSGAPDALRPLVEQLWQARLVPYERHVRERTWDRPRPVLVPADPTWPAQARRLASRLRLVLGEVALRVDHVGPTAVAGLDAEDVLDLQVTVRSPAAVDGLADALADGGFPRHGGTHDDPKAEHPDPAGRAERLHVHADPGRPANVHLRLDGSPGQRLALVLRDWLRDQPEVVAERTAAVRDTEVLPRAAAEQPWFDAASPRALAWAELTGWEPGPPGAS
jgi:dephospho-CoA kinase